MNILITGSGGREHALAWQCAKDTEVNMIFVAPGNAGTDQENKCKNIQLETTEHNAVIKFCHDNHIDLVIVGPEAPLVAGLVDDCQKAGIAIWGPSQYCAQLEGSKTFAKEFMNRHSIPTAKYQAFTDVNSAKAYVDQCGVPIVVKADGLAAGKGVIVADSKAQAYNAIEDMLEDNKFGDAGSRVVIEQFLQGEEASFICMIDGDNILPMATSQDHKRVGEADTGPNTGGMGAYSPAPVVTDEVYLKVMTHIIEPVVSSMKQAGHPYTGFLYAGLMIDALGDPYVIEFNCRLGDPETQPILMRLKSSLVALISQGIKGNLPTQAKWDTRPALAIVMASKGYPETASKGDVIAGLPPSNDDANFKIFHAGTKVDERHIVTNGGRVLSVTALGESILEAQQTALSNMALISFDGAHYRRDIGYQAINRETC